MSSLTKKVSEAGQEMLDKVRITLSSISHLWIFLSSDRSYHVDFELLWKAACITLIDNNITAHYVHFWHQAMCLSRQHVVNNPLTRNVAKNRNTWWSISFREAGKRDLALQGRTSDLLKKWNSNFIPNDWRSQKLYPQSTRFLPTALCFEFL